MTGFMESAEPAIMHYMAIFFVAVWELVSEQGARHRITLENVCTCSRLNLIRCPAIGNNLSHVPYSMLFVHVVERQLIVENVLNNVKTLRSVGLKTYATTLCSLCLSGTEARGNAKGVR